MRSKNASRQCPGSPVDQMAVYIVLHMVVGQGGMWVRGRPGFTGYKRHSFLPVPDSVILSKFFLPTHPETGPHVPVITSPSVTVA